MPKILVVEDDLVFSYLIQYHLELDHYVVEAVKTGAEGLARLEQRIFDLAILDWMLPDMLGVDVCKKFRAQGGTTPILLLTAKNSSQEKAAGLDSGADDYLVKPFDPTEFLARLRALLRRPAGLVRSCAFAISNSIPRPTGSPGGGRRSSWPSRRSPFSSF